MRIWVRMPRILGRSFKQECRYIGTSNWITSLIHGSTFGKKNIGSQLKGEKIGVASMTNNNTARSNRVTVAMRNSHRMSWLVSFWDAFRNYWIRLRSTLAKRWHSTSHGCSIRHHIWCFYLCPAHSLCPRLSSKSALSSLQWTTSKLLSARYYLSTHDRGPTCARLWSIPSRGSGPLHSLHESYGRQSRPP